jgi:hypothetical protein
MYAVSVAEFCTRYVAVAVSHFLGYVPAECFSTYRTPNVPGLTQLGYLN